MEYATTSYLDKQMSPVGGIYRLWFAVFAVRYWRYWMLCDETYPLAKHFFTSNASMLGSKCTFTSFDRTETGVGTGRTFLAVYLWQPTV